MPKISDGLYFIPGQDDFVPDSHTYILGEPDSGNLSIIDVGLVGKGSYKTGAMRKLGIDPSLIKRIILTHTHIDHIGCLSEMKKEMPEAELWVHSFEGEMLEKGQDNAVYGLEEFKKMCSMQYGLQEGAFTFKVDNKLQGGEVLAHGDIDWEIINIPGHSIGGIALYQRRQRILIPGDVVYADYAIGRFDLYGADAAQLKASLDRLAGLDVDILLPGHNQIARGLPPDYIEKTATMWAPYLR